MTQATPATDPADGSWATRVLNYLDEHATDTISTLRDLIRVPSISGSDAENDIQASLAVTLTELGHEVDHWQIPLTQTLGAPDFPGVEVHRDEAWGLISRMSGSGDGPSLMLNAHVDVVPAGETANWAGADPFSAHVDHDGIHGRGACDMKGGLAAALWAVRALTELRVPLRGDLLLACVQGEEDGGLGTYATLARGWRADACVIPEPTSLDLVPANAGSLTFRLTVHGRAVHASRRLAGVSAVEVFWPIFVALRELEGRRNRDIDPLMSRWDLAYPIEVGTVTAGNWSSTVPDLLVAEGRYGVRLGEDTDHARAQFEEAIATANQAHPWLRTTPVEVQWWGGQFAPGATAHDSPILATVARAHHAVTDRAQQRWAAPYGSDLRLLIALGAIPTVQYGPGDVTLAHGPLERVPTQEVLTTAKTLALTVLEHCGTTADAPRSLPPRTAGSS